MSGTLATDALVQDAVQARTRAVVATIAALALVNAGLAGLIALAAGGRGIVPAWALVVVLVIGAAAAVAAVAFWRAYLARARR